MINILSAGPNYITAIVNTLLEILISTVCHCAYLSGLEQGLNELSPVYYLLLKLVSKAILY